MARGARIRSATDFAALERAAEFIDHDSPPHMCEAAVVAYTIASLDPDADTDALPNLTHFISDQPLSPRGQEIVAEAVIRVVRDGSVPQARSAIVYFSHSSPDHSAALADAIADRIEKDEERLVGGAMLRLATLANSNEHAWSRYLPLVTHSNSNIRRFAVRLLSVIKNRREATVQFLERALDDPSDHVAKAAVGAMRFSNVDLASRRQRLLDIARARPVVGGEIVWSLGVKKDAHPDVLALLRERLQSDDKDQLWMTLGAIKHFGPLAAPLRPDLEAFAAGPNAKLVEDELKNALNSLERQDDSTAP